ncbi:MAG: type II toxin-antitoxin system RelE/ParE family toxin [Sphingorhabdus sp.]
MAYRLAPAADLDLDDIYDFGFVEFGMELADTYLDGLIACFSFLSENPEVARQRHEVRPPVRAHPHRSHVVVYEVNDNRDVLILRVHHSRANWLDL